MSEHYDVIIIGTGAGGGTLAHRLAPTGKRILLLERGGYLPREPENWDSKEIFLKERYLSGEEWIDRDGNAFHPHQQYFVGGNTKFYGAILFRLRERDFHEVRHYAGVSPAWPLTYDDLEPYYTEAEKLYLVHGERGEDPTEAPASGPFPYPAVSLEPRFHARVERLETDASGRTVTEVVVERRGSEERYSADVVVVSCGAANSAALLLRSASDRHPRGLANASDVVGRHYMAHINSGVIAVSQTPNETKFQKTLGINDYYWGAEDSELPLGHIQMLGKSDRHILRGGAPWFAPGLALDFLAKHAIDFWMTTEDLPHPSNRVTVDRQGRIHLAKTDHNTEPHRRLLAKLKGLMGHLGCETMVPSWSVLDQRIPLAGVAHQCGTVRFGTDPETSALDIDCRAHDVDNLYVVDTSFFPSSSAVNPALTAMANALRVGDHLIERLGAPAAAAEADGKLDAQLQEAT